MEIVKILIQDLTKVNDNWKKNEFKQWVHIEKVSNLVRKW